MTRAYESTHDLCKRFRCSSRTLFRRMKRGRNPFPAPCIRHVGSCNLWDAAEVAAWEETEWAHARAPWTGAVVRSETTSALDDSK